MDLLQIINEVVSEDSLPESALGMKLFEAAKSYRKKAEGISVEEIPSELELKIRLLRGAEQEGNLAWMNQASWYRLPLNFREDFIERLDPLIWSGVYFRYNDFIEQVDVLLNLDSSYSIAIITDARNYRFVSVTSSAREFDSMP